MVLVSVVIPTYNRAHLIKDAVQSVLAQTLEDFELIVVDDGSTDNTREVMADLQSDRVHYIFQENRGASAARNAGIHASIGKYVTFLDSDDLYLPDKLAVQIAEMENHPEAAMSYHGTRVVDFSGNLLIETHADVDGWIYRETVFRGPIDSCIVTPAVMVRRSVLEEMGGFEETMHGAEDLDLWRRISIKYKVLGINQNLSTIRRGGGSGYYSGPDHIYQTIETYLKRVYQDDPGLYRLFRNPEVSNIYFSYAQVVKDNQFWDQQVKMEVTQKFLRQAIWYYPFDRKVYDLWRYFYPQSALSRLMQFGGAIRRGVVGAAHWIKRLPGRIWALILRLLRGCKRILVAIARKLWHGLKAVYHLGVRIVRRIPDVVRDPRLGVSFLKRFVRWGGRKVKGALRRFRAFVNG